MDLAKLLAAKQAPKEESNADVKAAPIPDTKAPSSGAANLAAILASKVLAPEKEVKEVPGQVAGQPVVSTPATPVNPSIPGLANLANIKTSVPQAAATVTAVSDSMAAANSLFASAMQAAKSVSKEAADAIDNTGSDIDTATSTHDDIRDKLFRMNRMMEENHPGMVNFINQIHEILIKRHDLVAILTDEEIGQIVTGLAVTKDITITKEIVKKASNKRSSKNVTVDDI